MSASGSAPGPVSGPSSASESQSSAAQTAVQFSIDRHAAVSTLLARLNGALAGTSMPPDELSDLLLELKDEWWAAAQKVDEQHQHRSRRHHIYDWPAFLRENLPAARFAFLLNYIHNDEWNKARAMKGALPRLAGAAKALGLENPIELMLEIGEEACTNTAALMGISSLRAPRNVEGTPPAAIRDQIRRETLRRHQMEVDNWEEDSFATMAKDVRAAVKHLKEQAEAKPKAKKAKASRGTKRKRADDDDDEHDDEEEEDDEPELSRVSKRRRLGQDEVSMALGQQYMAGLADDGPSLLETFMSEPAEFVALGGSSSRGSFGGPMFDTTAGSSAFNINPADTTLASNRSSSSSPAADPADITITAESPKAKEQQPTEAEKDEAEAANDALVREQLELFCRLVQTGPAKPGPGAALTGGVFASVSQMALTGLMAAQSDGLLGQLESRRRAREERATARSGAAAAAADAGKGKGKGKGKEKVVQDGGVIDEDEDDYYST
ncbi:hypothetical protein K4K55_001086 [Colletotrichum sp. SAR 10_96]|nr:hypothetical protein K4K55_001086 [Colletotrichum sp. SAR 10_96]